MRIAIAGAGIGGLTAAISLHKKGFDVQVFESVNEIKALGVGINLLPHAVRVLTALGLIDAISKSAVATSELAYYNKFGQKIWQEPRGKFAGYHWPQYSIHRGILQTVLLQCANELIGERNIHTGHHLQSCANNADKVAASFLNRYTNETVTIEADVLIGADGIHSAVRKQFYPTEGAPAFSGIILHRGTAKAKPFLTGSSMIMAGSARQKFVAYPISPTLDENGDQLINWIADLPAADADLKKERDWNRKCEKEKILPYFKDWDFDWLNVPGLIEAASAIYEFPMSDRDPLQQWSFGRITLLGDAAHPMYPIGSNGGSQAILDAESITECLVQEKNVVKSLLDYEQVRLPATSKIVLQNRRMGPEEVMQIVEDRAPNGFNELDKVISREELEEIAARYKKIAGFEKETLNLKR